MDVLGVFFLVFGLFFFTVGIVSIFRLPDALSRLNASGKVSTVGIGGMLIGVALLLPGAAIKAIALGLFMLLAGPVVSHAIAVTTQSRDAIQK